MSPDNDRKEPEEPAGKPVEPRTEKAEEALDGPDEKELERARQESAAKRAQ